MSEITKESIFPDHIQAKKKKKNQRKANTFDKRIHFIQCTVINTSLKYGFP